MPGKPMAAFIAWAAELWRDASALRMVLPVDAELIGLVAIVLPQ